MPSDTAAAHALTHPSGANVAQITSTTRNAVRVGRTSTRGIDQVLLRLSGSPAGTRATHAYPKSTGEPRRRATSARSPTLLAGAPAGRGGVTPYAT